jgi:putative transposase
MLKFYHSLLLLIAGATEKQLARQIQNLKAKNLILRSKLPERIIISRRERRTLMKFGRHLGKAIQEVVSIVHPSTFLRWLREEKKSSQKTESKKRGRRRTAEEIRKLVVKLVKENEWGYTRILGELKKLGIKAISRNTVKNILKEHGLDPGPKRGEGTWDEFLKRHASTLWACDFFSKKVWTPKGLVDVFVLFFLNVGKRNVEQFAVSTHPTGAWMAQQARNLVMARQEADMQPRFLIRNRDTKFTAEFDRVLESEGMEVIQVGPRAPNMNAYAERWVQAIKQECLDHFIVFGERHLNHLVREYVVFHDEQGRIRGWRTVR